MHSGRNHHFTKFLLISSRQSRHGNSHLIISKGSFTCAPGVYGTTGREQRCYTESWQINCGTGVSTTSNRRRAFSISTAIPEDQVADVGNQTGLTLQELPSPALPSSLDAVKQTKGDTESQKRKSNPEYVRAIVRNVEVGKLSQSDIKAIMTEAFELSRMGTTNLANITYAEQLVHRLVQEVNHRHLVKLDVRKDQNLGSSAFQTSNVIQALGTMWHYVIIGSSFLPAVVVNRSQATIKEGKPNTSEAAVKQPFVTTGALLMNMLYLHHKHPTIHPPPTATLYNAWLYSCFISSSVTDDALHVAQAILRNLEGSLYNDEDGTVGQGNARKFDILPPPANITKPTKGMYNHVILIHAHRAKTIYGAAVQAENLLMRMSKVGVHPGTDTFNRVLKAWSECPEKEGGNRAADVLHIMLSLSADPSKIAHGDEIAPDEISFGTVITAFAKRGQPEACQLILEEAVAYFASNPKLRSRMATLDKCWNTALTGWAKSGRPDAPERIEALLNNGIMIDDQQYKLTPTKSTYVACIEAHLKSDRSDRIEKAESFLNILINSMRKVESDQIVATTREFNTLINAWFRSLEEYENIGINKDTGMHPIGYTATKASSLLFQMLQLEEEGYHTCKPSSGSFHMCIESLCRTAASCLNAAKKVTKVVSRAQKDEDLELAHEFKSSMKNYAILAAEEALEILALAEDRKLPTDSTYATVIQLLSRIGTSQYASKAAEVLLRYEQKTDEWNLQWQEKKEWIYHHVITALNMVGTLESAEAALQILRRIPKHGKRAIERNGVNLYNNVLNAFQKHPCERSRDVAIELFRELISAPQQDPELKNSINLDFCERALWILADSYSKQSAESSYDMLKTLLDLHSVGKISFEPSMSCFNACIFALSAVRDLKYAMDSVQLLKSIVRKYENKSISKLPSKTAFDLVIRNCNEIGSQEMLQHAKDITLLKEKYAIADIKR